MARQLYEVLHPLAQPPQTQQQHLSFSTMQPPPSTMALPTTALPNFAQLLLLIQPQLTTTTELPRSSQAQQPSVSISHNVAHQFPPLLQSSVTTNELLSEL